MKQLDVLLIDPSVISGDGHHYTYLHQHRIEFSKLQIDVKAFVSTSVDDDFRRKKKLIPAFQTSLHARRAYTWAEFTEFADNFERDMFTIVREHLLRPDIVLVSTADQSMILGLAQYLKNNNDYQKPEVLIFIGTAPHHHKPCDDPSIGPQLAEYKEAFSKLRDALSDDTRLHIFTEPDAMAVYQRYCEVKIETVPVRKRSQRPRQPRVRRSGDPINVVCVGNAAKNKGYGLLPDAICRLNKARNDLRFSIHGTVAHTGFPEAKSIMEALPRLGNNVRTSTDTLSAEDYIAWLSDADIAMLPYDTYVYRTQGSAVFDEAVGLGIPVVAPTACDFAKSAISEGRAVGIEEVTAEGLANAVEIAATRIEQLTDRAARYSANQDIDTSLRDTIGKAVAIAERRLSWFDSSSKRLRRLFKRVSVWPRSQSLHST